MTVNITGLSFTHMNSEISAWLEVTYTDSAKNFSTADNSVVYNSTQIIENAATAGNDIAAAFKDLMNQQGGIKMKFEAPEINKVSFETENIAEIKPGIQETGSGDLA